MKLLILNGPNLNLLGSREPAIYGSESYDALCQQIQRHAAAIGCTVALLQSNHEGALIDAIQGAQGVYGGIVINPGAYAHYSYAIYDALRAVDVPAWSGKEVRGALAAKLFQSRRQRQFRQKGMSGGSDHVHGHVLSCFCGAGHAGRRGHAQGFRRGRHHLGEHSGDPGHGPVGEISGGRGAGLGYHGLFRLLHLRPGGIDRKSVV